MWPTGDPGAWCTELPWLAEFGFDAQGRAAAVGSSPLLATSLRRLGPRLALAREHDGAEALGIDMVHAAVDELLAQHALPQCATLAVAAPRASAVAPGLVAGVLRACRSHGVPLALPVAATAATEQIGLTMAGTPLGALVPAPAVGDVVLALRSTGPTDGDFEALAAEVQRRGLAWRDRLANGDTVARAVLAPRASHASVLHEGLRQGWPFCAVAVDGPIAAAMRTALPRGLDVAFDFGAWRPPAPFDAWFTVDPARAAAATSFGCSFVVLVAPREADRFLAHCAAWNEPATPIGRVVAAG